MTMIKLQAAFLIISCMVFSSICGTTSQPQPQTSEAPLVESTHIVAGESWSDSLQEWGCKIGCLLAFCFFLHYIICSDSRQNHPAPMLKPWEYIDRSGQIGSIYSTSAAISKNFPAYVSQDNH